MLPLIDLKKKKVSETPSKTESISQIQVVFMGTPAFACGILDGLFEASYHIVAVYTQPDKPAGKEKTLTPSPVKLLAQEHSVPIETPAKLDEAAVAGLKDYRPDLIVVAAYGKILPVSLLEIPGFGCINVHASLLPRWRGASPIQNALLAGETETGVTLMLMEKGLDTGPVIAQKPYPIKPEDTTASLLESLSQLGKDMLLETLPLWVERRIEPILQKNEQATLCQLIERKDGHIFWMDDAEIIYNRYRALFPWPGIFGFWQKNGEMLRVKFRRVSCQKKNPQTKHHLGEIFEIGDAVGVQAATGVILLEEVQLAGKKALPIKEFIKGYPQFIGSVLQ